MKPESAQQIKQLEAARNLLRSAFAQYTTAVHGLGEALAHTAAALATSDEEAHDQILELGAFVRRLSGESLEAHEAFDALAETLEALTIEVTTREEHIPAGVS